MGTGIITGGYGGGGLVITGGYGSEIIPVVGGGIIIRQVTTVRLTEEQQTTIRRVEDGQ